MNLFKTTCPQCGRELDGNTLRYGMSWLCCNCAHDKTNVLHCERGRKVKAVELDAGYDSDSKKAHRLLIDGGEYTVARLDVGGSQSDIELLEIPGERFNTVHFVRMR